VTPTIDIAATLEAGHRYARNRTGNRQPTTDRAIDAVTDAVWRAQQQYLPDRGAWEPWCWSFIHRAVRGALNRTNRITVPLAGTETATELFTPTTTILLPACLDHAIRLYFVDRYSLRDAGLLSGLTHEGFRRRLHRAAALIGRDLPTPRPGRPRNRLTRT
jgi:DNA-directed RNA polymerase specialized sigma24 family protein